MTPVNFDSNQRANFSPAVASIDRVRAKGGKGEEKGEESAESWPRDKIWNPVAGRSGKIGKKRAKRKIPSMGRLSRR